MQTIHNAGDAVLVSFTNALSRFLGFIPNLIGALVLLIVGWILAGIVAKLISSVLQTVGFEKAVERAGIGGFLQRAGTSMNASQVLALLVKWFIRLIFIQAAANALDMPQVTTIINSIVLFIPNVIVAMVIVVIGALLGKVVGDLVRGAVSEMGAGNPTLLAAVARYAIIGFAVIAALSQLDIAPTIVNTLFIGLVAALALAAGLAFGLGGRDVAAELTQSWYAGGKGLVSKAQSSTGSQNGHENSSTVRRPANWKSSSI